MSDIEVAKEQMASSNDEPETDDTPCLASENKTEGVPCAAEEESGADDIPVDILQAVTAVGNEQTEEKHISIVQSLSELMELADVNDDLCGTPQSRSRHREEEFSNVRKCCPLCPESRVKACTINKLQRHLQNLHWQISVEYEGYRMCICQLECSRRLKSEINGEQSVAKMGPHYHCIICADKISRRTDMLSHMKRHVSKGETKIKFLAGTPAKAHTQPSEELLKEADTNVQVFPNYSTPQKTESFFNPKMKSNRQLIFCALAVLAQERHPLECLDAFGSTGIMGLQWAKHLGSSVKVTINDINEKSVEMIRENCHINKMKVIMDKDDEEDECDETADDFIGSVEVTMQDANVLMHLRAFDFIHLDPFGTTVNFLDAAFRNVRNLGIVSVTSTDISSLYGKVQHVAKRHYGVNIIRTEYFRELAARIVLAAVARAASRCNKGIDVLLSVALEHFVLVVVRVLRGPTEADGSTDKIRTLIHCQWCEERIFRKEGHMVGDSPYRQLPCNCHESMPGKSAIELGPVWSGTIFNNGFLRRMLYECVQRGIDDIQPLLKTLICEAECTTHKQLSITLSHNQEECGVIIKTPTAYMADDQHKFQGKRKRQEMNVQGAKRWKPESRVEHPSFYYSIHRHSIRGMNSPKLNRFLQNLAQTGFLVSRTHFDPLGVRTNATLATFKCILEQHSTTSHTVAAGVATSVEASSTEETELVEPYFKSESGEDTENHLSDDFCLLKTPAIS